MYMPAYMHLKFVSSQALDSVLAFGGKLIIWRKCEPFKLKFIWNELRAWRGLGFWGAWMRTNVHCLYLLLWIGKLPNPTIWIKYVYYCLCATHFLWSFPLFVFVLCSFMVQNLWRYAADHNRLTVQMRNVECKTTKQQTEQTIKR